MVMNQNVELLNFIYQNAEMGVITIKQLLDIVKDEDFCRHLKSQLEEYEQIHSKARDLLEKHGFDEKGIGTFEKLRTYLMINMQTLTDKTPSHIAEMMIIGSNMGIIDAVKNINHYADAESDLISLMKKLLQVEENNVQQLKKFL